MTEAEILALINLHIVANGNNEITANILRPILQEMLSQPNDKMGELEDLDTTDKSSIVNAINEIFNASNSSFDIHTGTADPNVTHPSTYSIGDWYVRSGSSLYQYNGAVWVLLSSTPTGTNLVAESFTYTSPNNMFELANDLVDLIDVQIGNGSNFDEYASVANGNEVTISTDVLFGGEKVKIIYNK